MKYKGYIGTVGYSEEDKVFFGKIEGIKGLINFEGSSVDELERDFHEAVDSYIELCEAKGIKPQKSYSGSLNIRIAPNVHSHLAQLAAETGTSINNVIKTALTDYVGHAHH